MNHTQREGSAITGVWRAACACLVAIFVACDDGGSAPATTDDASAPDAQSRPIADASPPQDAQACVPEPEICDDQDNDCDGRVDEGFPGLGARCQVGEGPCAGLGQFACLPDGTSGCDAVERQPVPEICDGIDNDCDGRVDEGIDLARDPENCGGCGRACTAPGAVLVCDVGTCQLGQCLPGFGDANGILADGCECEVAGDGSERCNGEDDDCDGRIDEGLGLGEACVDGIGSCRAPGVIACGADEMPTCDAPVGVPAVERCNGFDDDCDGAIDEAFDLDGDGFPRCPDLNCDDPATCPPDADCESLCARQDCDDDDPSRNPGAREICDDGADQNCSGADAPCNATLGRITAFGIAVAGDARCRDLTGDGRLNNAFAPIARFVNPLMTNAINGSQLNLFPVSLGIATGATDGRFDLAILVAVVNAEGELELSPDSMDANGEPIMMFPNANLVAGELQAGPGTFLLGLPVPGGRPGELRVTQTLIRGRVQIGPEGLSVDEGVVIGVVSAEDLTRGLQIMPPEIGPIIERSLVPDIDTDDDGEPDGYSACAYFTVRPRALLGYPPAP